MFALGEGKLGWFFRENLNIPSLIWTSTPKMDTQNSLFSEKFKKFFKNTLHYVCTGRGQFVGCFAKKFKIAFTYSHWEKPFAHPNSEIFTKNSKTPLTYLHKEKVKSHPDSEMFTKDSKSPLIMFAMENPQFGIISEKFLKIFSWRQKCCHKFKIILCYPRVDGRFAVTLQTPFTCL